MINNFDKEEYAFLSNEYVAPVIYDDIEFDCNEVAYQAAKCKNDMDKFQFININGYAAKKLSRQIPIRPDWNEVKLTVMEEICEAKFTQNKKLMKKLIATDDEELIYGNEWGDTFWGICDGEGENHLGKILMEIRDKYKDEYVADYYIDDADDYADYYIDDAGNYYDSYEEYLEIFHTNFGGVPEKPW